MAFKLRHQDRSFSWSEIGFGPTSFAHQRNDRPFYPCLFGPIRWWVWKLSFSQSEDVSDHSWTFTKILLNEFWSNNTNKWCCCMMSNSLCQHCLKNDVILGDAIDYESWSMTHGLRNYLSAAWWTVHEDTTWWINTNLLVKFIMSQWKFNGFTNFLFLSVQTTNIAEISHQNNDVITTSFMTSRTTVPVWNVGLFISAQHCNGRICLWW